MNYLHKNIKNTLKDYIGIEFKYFREKQEVSGLIFLRE